MPNNILGAALGAQALIMDDLVEAEAVGEQPLDVNLNHGINWADAEVQPAYKKQKVNTEPPLELNLAAKKPDPYTQLNTIEEAYAAIAAGRYMEYTVQMVHGSYREAFNLRKTWGVNQLQDKVNAGLFVHNTDKVMLYCAYCLDGVVNGVVGVWQGATYAEYLIFKDQPDVKEVFALHYIDYPGDYIVV